MMRVARSVILTFSYPPSSYACHLHPFLPVVDLSDPRDAHKVVREKSPFLFSCIMAVAARFSSYFHDGSLDFGEAANNGVPAIVEDAYVQMVMIAEDHLSRSLLRKQHTLSDVQATLLLAGWGLHSGLSMPSLGNLCSLPYGIPLQLVVVPTHGY